MLSELSDPAKVISSPLESMTKAKSHDLTKVLFINIRITLLLVFGIVLSSDLALRAFDLISSPGKRHFKQDVEPFDEVQSNYAEFGLTIDDVKVLYEETWRRNGWQYEEVLGFRETPFHGLFVNVSPEGHRLNHSSNHISSSNEPFLHSKPVIYVFGGSTTFGYGVSDNHTIPAFLEAKNPGYRFINYGRGYYYSKQENMLFEDLLDSKKKKPVLAIFIDGINERCNISVYQQQMKILFENASTRGYSWHPTEFFKPLAIIASKLASIGPSESVGIKYSEPRCKDRYTGRYTKLTQVFQLNLQKRANLCQSYNVNCITFIQPVPGWMNIHKYADIDPTSAMRKISSLASVGYSTQKHQVVDITDALSYNKNHAFIDDIHYSPLSAKLIAARIHRSLKLEY